jgi:eukaryotic-like serine/threonine-protein kinase
VTEPHDAPPPPPDPTGVPAAPDAAPSDVGRLIDERYRLAEVIGSGGMATVHRALDTRLDRPVAVKLLRREIVEDPDLAMRFRREALAATVLRHPNIVACLETGTDDGQPYLVMELIEGEDLAARLKRSGRLAPTDAARIALDVARALGVAHVRGIVHRDVKPANILLARDGRAMVTDFGIARLAADAEGAVPGMTLGSVHYFSPEQAKGETTSATSDVYSLGLVLYEALTGQRAWHGDTTAQLAAVRIDAPPPSPKAVRPEIPGTLDAIVVRALDPDPARRYASGSAIAAALEPFVAQPDPSSPTVAFGGAALAAGAGSAGPATPLAPPLRPVSASSVVPVARSSRRRASPAIAGPLIVLLVVVAVVGGAIGLAALPGRDGAIAVASASPRPTRTPVATPRITPKPSPTATPEPAATPEPVPPTAQPAGNVSGLCEPIFGFPCGLGAGVYQPPGFEPAIRFRLGEGWSTTLAESDIIGLGRDTGALTFASDPDAVYPSGDPVEAPSSAGRLVDAFVSTDGVTASRPQDGRVDKRKATLVDLTPAGNERIGLFGTANQTFYLEAHATTRVIVVEVKGSLLVIAIEPTEATTLEDVLPAANRVIDSLRFR